MSSKENPKSPRTKTEEEATRTTVKAAVFATPDREIGNLRIKEESPSTLKTDHATKTVTPPESAARDTVCGKQVRFDQEKMDETDQKEDVQLPLSNSADSPSSNGSNRGLVSRRGGRYGSPGRLKKESAVLEYKTYRSPQRPKETVENDTVPSLCSSNSGNLTSTTSSSSVLTKEGKGTENATESKSKMEEERPSSISCDTSQDDTTSPLGASHDASNDTTKSPAKARLDEKDQNGRRNTVFSPPPPPREEIALDKTKKTPTRSPVGQFQSLPSLKDAKLSSPCGIFLSPYPPSPSAYATIAAGPSFDEEKPLTPKPPNGDGDKSRSRDQERERAVATPTDFSVDFGRDHRSTHSFDASNVLAWLQSPTANGLFSPGGLGSVSNTPRAGGAPRTPRTPTMSTSFFFSDVASLPRNGEFASPKPGVGVDVGGKRMSSMISISPLASSKRNGGRVYPQRESRTSTPLNYKDVFASPRHPYERSIRPRSMPMLGESPATKGKTKSRTGDSDLDAVHLAERDLMEDEDLSVLLQLASHNNTPRSKDSEVFRSQQRRKNPIYRHDSGSNPSLQLPVIGREGETGGTTKLTRKKAKDSPGVNPEDFTPPPLGIRSSSSGASREMFTRSDDDPPPGEKGSNKKSKGNDNPQGSDDKPDTAASAATTTATSRRKKSSKRKGIVSGPAPYPVPPYHHPGPDGPVPYYPMPGSMPSMPPGGSMRVVVGGPPPLPRSGSKKSGSSSPRHGSPSRPPHYPMQHPPDGYGPHGSMYPPPPPGHYPHPPHPHMPGMPPPYHGHYPPPPHPPRHMPMYPHPPPTKSIKGAKKPKAGKKAATSKRPYPVGKAPPPATKKAKKGSPKVAVSAKKKKPSPPVSSDPMDRQKSAAAIAAVNAASGGKNDKAAALAAAILRGVTMRPSGKWQAQLYYAGKSRYIGVFDTREKAALAYEIAREKLKADGKTTGDQSLKATENAVNAARKAAFEGVNEKDPRLAAK